MGLHPVGRFLSFHAICLMSGKGVSTEKSPLCFRRMGAACISIMRLSPPPLPDSVIDAACAGDSVAMELALLHYDGYITH